MVLLIGFNPLTSRSQECTSYFPMQEGSSFEIMNYDPKDKVQGRAEHFVISREERGDEIAVQIESTIFDKKDKEVTTLEYEVRCKNGVFEFLMPSVSMESMAGAGVSTDVEGDFLDIPADPSPGQKLKDGTIRISINEAMNMTTTVTDRKVEALEQITTPAGTFDCIKITYSVETKFLFKVTGAAAEWYAPNVGMVRSESYDKKGKLSGYSLLTKLDL